DPVALALDGLTIEAGDGARPGSWEVIWRGTAGVLAPPGAPFLIAGDALVGALQNGPDALRLSRNGVVLDLLGYGELSSAALYEGAPAPDVGSGQSLARVRDGIDGNDNAADWAVESEPTPGLANHPDIRLRISRSGLSPSPEVAWPGETISLRACVRNTGRLRVEGGRWRLDAEWARDEVDGAGLVTAVTAAVADSNATWIGAASRAGVAIDSGDSATLLLEIAAPAPGAWRCRVRMVSLDDSAAVASDLALRPDTLEVPVRSVAGPAVVTEFAFRDAGAGEWIELWFRDPVDDVGAISIADAVSSPRPIDRGAETRPVPAGALLVIAQDPALVRERFALPDSLVLGVTGGWPSLNDTDGDAAIADRVRILAVGRVPCDAVPYRAAASTRGASVERLSVDLPSAAAGTWAECINPKAGTPGRENSMRAPSGTAASRGPLLIAGGRVVRRGQGAAVPVVLRTTPAARGRRLTVRVHDLLGRPVRTLVEGQRFASDGAFVWDGKDDRGDPVTPGLYVIRAEALPENDAAIRASSVPMAVAP
ncbi:MAG: FlgD immunoglobulin-like domain containing protein, partial [Candidatus Eiseniibacteriota bacterium]